MTKCYEQLYFEPPAQHCGNALRINGEYYCPLEGVFRNYGNMRCAAIKPPKQKEPEQLSFSGWIR